MTFEQLMKANESIKTTDIKGKQYAEVNQRIKVFRMLYPNGTIETKIEQLEKGVCVIKASAKDEDGVLLGTGYAYETEGSSFINKTSYIENCETSAVGRALGMIGIGIDTSVASFEEVANAVKQQEEHKPITDNMIKALHSKFDKEGISEEKVLSIYRLKNLKDMTLRQHSNMMEHFKEVKEKCHV
nr:MAG TPA: hypothetical protein [Caudoviricetes sp.]